MKKIARLFLPPIVLTGLKRLFNREPDWPPQAEIGRNVSLKNKLDIRHPASRIKIGDDCFISAQLATETEASFIEIANNVFIGNNTILDCVKHIKIEEYVMISYRCIIADSDNHSLSFSIRKNDLAKWRDGEGLDWASAPSKPIHIKRGAWIGAQSIILKGVTIGEGAVIGAGSVVTSDVPDWSVAAGNPARVIKEIPVDER
jgi:acetyltransferase-like isoleucine patch superfamily enzyme